MTVAAATSSARGERGVRHELAWHAPPHALMLGVMAIVMTPGYGVGAHLAGAGALALLTLGLAPFARRRAQLAPVLLDAGAMAIVIVGCAMAAPAVAFAGGSTLGGHHHGVDGTAMAVLVGVAWLVARLRCTRGPVATVTGAIAAMSLVAMSAVALA